ncbi:MAG: hypothetical protein COB16_07280 [Rhodobacteraceae bacterium]|nr:MAG: hypothetical protein COB16_07280 [Paracoccaceae bacterium]
MCYFDHIVMMKLQLGPWQPERPLRPHEREHEYHARLHAQKQAQGRVNTAGSGWPLISWLRRVKRQLVGPG